jgi:hypothetical protein
LKCRNIDSRIHIDYALIPIQPEGCSHAPQSKRPKPLLGRALFPSVNDVADGHAEQALAG